MVAQPELNRIRNLKRGELPDLIIGIGNCGRADDGLGWAFLDAIGEQKLFEGEVVYRYQLQVEDAELISGYKRVLFVDAYSGPLQGGISLETVEPNIEHSFSSHALEPGTIVALCNQIYNCTPEAQVLMIEGEVFKLESGLSAVAQTNLETALQFFMARYKYDLQVQI